MKYLLPIFILMLLLIGLQVDAGRKQKRARPASELHCDCMYYPLYHDTERHWLFPFSVSQSVVVLSFQTQRTDTAGLSGTDTFGYYGVRQIVTLDKKQADCVFDYLFHYYPQDLGYKRNVLLNTGVALCYNPHHAILFLDERHQQVAKIEICFHCSRIVTVPADMLPGMDCCNRWSLLAVTLKDFGITYELPSE